MEGDWLDWLKVGGATGVGIGSAGGAFMGLLLFFRWMLNFIAGRTDINQLRMDKLQKELLDRLSADVAELREENRVMRGELKNCEERHIVSDRKIAELEAAAMVPGMARQQAQQIIAANAKEREV